MMNFGVLLCLLMSISSSNCQFQPIVIQEPTVCPKQNLKMTLFSTQTLRIVFNQTRLQQLNIHTIHVYASIANRKVAELVDHRHTKMQVYQFINTTSESNDNLTIIDETKIYGKYMDQTHIHYSIESVHTDGHIDRTDCSMTLLVSQPKRLRDKIFKGAIPFIIMLVSVQMGMLLDTEVLKELARRPIQPLIGFICQYGFMPLIAFAITKIFRYDPIFGLGLFVVGCCPGGTQSNQWTVVFDGDLNLSSFMSFVSTVVSFVMMPLWLYTLGQYAYLSQLKIYIPFWNLAQSLLTIIGPLGLGMLIVYFVPKLKQPMQRIVKPIMIATIFYFLVFGMTVNYYLFYYIDLRTAITCPFLPWFGFLLGGGFAWICGQDWKRTLTIGIETGIQNIGIAIMVLLYSLPPPSNSQGPIIPIIIAYLSPTPFYLILIYQIICKKFCSKTPRDSIDTLSKITGESSEPNSEILPTAQPLLSNSEGIDMK